MTTTTATRLGALRTEGTYLEGPNGQGSPSIAAHRPIHRPLRNDGVHPAPWMLAGETYRLDLDGPGWVVSCSTWPADLHTLRLWDLAAGQFASTLHLDGGRFVLQPGCRYEIRYAVGAGWDLYQL